MPMPKLGREDSPKVTVNGEPAQPQVKAEHLQRVRPEGFDPRALVELARVAAGAQKS